ncbi:hypothetical protein ABKN59_010815 [Abortiporus biennis]
MGDCSSPLATDIADLYRHSNIQYGFPMLSANALLAEEVFIAHSLAWPKFEGIPITRTDSETTSVVDLVGTSTRFPESINHSSTLEMF